MRMMRTILSIGFLVINITEIMENVVLKVKAALVSPIKTTRISNLNRKIYVRRTYVITMDMVGRKVDVGVNMMQVIGSPHMEIMEKVNHPIKSHLS